MTVTIKTLDGRIFSEMIEEEHHYCKGDFKISKINIKTVCEEANKND